MKKIIALILIFALILTFSSCKRPDEESGSAIITAQDEIATVADNSETEKENSDSAEQFKEDDNEQTEAVTETVQTETQNKETTEVEEPTETEEVTQTESETPAQQEPEVTYDKKDFLDTEYPSNLYHKEYLPYSLGYVQKLQRDDGSYYYRAEEDFIITEPITDEIIEAALNHPDYRYALDSVSSNLYNIVFQDATTAITIESYEEYANSIIRGHFEEGNGTAKIVYTIKDHTRDESVINWNSNACTVYNFVIDKVYDESCGYKVGDVIEVAYEHGFIGQDHNGYYWGFRYYSFEDLTLEERSYVISLRNSEVFNMPTIDAICQNIYAEVEEGSIEYQILQKYN